MFFNSHQTLARNGFAQYADEESEMIKDMKPDDDWDEEHIPQAFGVHNITNYPEIFEMFGIELHAQFRGQDCLEQYAKYLLKFDKRINIDHLPHTGSENCPLCQSKAKQVSFTEYIKKVNYAMNSTPEQEEKYNTTKNCIYCAKPYNIPNQEIEDVHDEDVIWQSDEEEISQEFEEEISHEENDELELALSIAGKRIARFDEEHWGRTFECIKEHDEAFSEQH